MSRAPSFPAYHPFKAWLISDRLISGSSARTYAACVSSLLDKIPKGADITDEAVVKTALESLQYGSGYATYRTAWKAFTEWCLTKGVIVPHPKLVRVVPAGSALPEAGVVVADHLNRLGVPLVALSVLRVEHIRVDPRRGYTSLPDPTSPGSYLTLGKEVLSDWLASWPGEDGPLFPREAGSSEAYPTKTLRILLTAYRKKLVEKEVADTYEVFVAKGSALPPSAEAGKEQAQADADAAAEGSALTQEDIQNMQEAPAYEAPEDMSHLDLSAAEETPQSEGLLGTTLDLLEGLEA